MHIVKVTQKRQRSSGEKHYHYWMLRASRWDSEDQRVTQDYIASLGPAEVEAPYVVLSPRQAEHVAAKASSKLGEPISVNDLRQINGLVILPEVEPETQISAQEALEQLAQETGDTSFALLSQWDERLQAWLCWSCRRQPATHLAIFRASLISPVRRTAQWEVCLCCAADRPTQETHPGLIEIELTDHTPQTVGRQIASSLGLVRASL